MKKYIKFKLDEIPKGSPLEKYVTQLPKVLDRREEFHLFLCDVFQHCLKFLIRNVNVESLPQFTLKLVHTRVQFLKEEQRESENVSSKEDARDPSLFRAFIAGNQFRARLYIDLEYFIDLMPEHGYPAFILSIVTTYFHEILHAAFPKKYEQEIHDMHCSLVESFLGIKLPEEMKKLRASDYYTKTN